MVGIRFLTYQHKKGPPDLLSPPPGDEWQSRHPHIHTSTLGLLTEQLQLDSNVLLLIMHLNIGSWKLK